MVDADLVLTDHSNFLGKQRIHCLSIRRSSDSNFKIDESSTRGFVRAINFRAQATLESLVSSLIIDLRYDMQLNG